VEATHYIVCVEDRRNAALTGSAGGTYASPPHTLDHAHELVAVLLDAPGAPLDGLGPWRRAVAGGERTVRLVPSSESPGAAASGYAPSP
jgi:hypothetical protein